MPLSPDPKAIQVLTESANLNASTQATADTVVSLLAKREMGWIALGSIH